MAYHDVLGVDPSPGTDEISWAYPARLWRRSMAVWTPRRLHYVGLVLVAVLVSTIWVAKSDSVARAKLQPGVPSGGAQSAAAAGAQSSPAAASGQVVTTPTVFPAFVQNLQADLRSGQIPGLAAIPAAVVGCPEPDLLFPGDVFACNLSGLGSGTAQVVVSVQAPHGQLFTVALGSAWPCPILSGAQVLALHGIGAATNC